MDNKITWIEFVKQIWLSPKKREYSEWIEEFSVKLSIAKFHLENDIDCQWLDESLILYKEEKEVLLDNPDILEKLKEKYTIHQIRRVVSEPFHIDIDGEIITKKELFSL